MTIAARRRPTALTLTLSLLALGVLANGVSAQNVRQVIPTDPAVTLGVLIGYNNQSSRPVLGASARLQTLPRFELVGGVDFHFLQGLTERQFTADVAVSPAVGGPAYLGGGVVVRNSIFGEPGAPKENKVGASLFLGLRGGALGPLTNQLEVRWAKVGAFDSLVFSLGFMYRIPFTS